jgi:putative tRNA adenosine deaminase-associated protein
MSRRGSDWSGDEVSLDGVEDLDGIVESLRQVAGDDADVSLLLVEEDEEWFALVRLDEDVDPRVFLSDGRVTETSRLGALFGEAATVQEAPVDVADDEDDDVDEDEEEGVRVAGDPIGDADLMSDLGMPAAKLLTLCAEEGQLPADILSAICEAAGCLEPLEALRET